MRLGDLHHGYVFRSHGNFSKKKIRLVIHILQFESTNDGLRVTEHSSYGDIGTSA